MKMITRRELLAGMSSLGLGLLISSCSPAATATPDRQAQVSATAFPVPTNAPPVVPSVAPTQVSRPTERAIPAAPVSPDSESPTQIVEPTATLLAPTREPTPVPAEAAYLAAVRGNSPQAITQRAIAAIGGMERFVKSGYDVIIKPNICNANHGPEYASTTNPEVVATLVKLALGAGAKKVRVMDSPFAGSGKAAYASSGIAEVVEAAGGEMEVMTKPRYAEVAVPEGRDLKSWEFYRAILDADLVINVPIAKHHSLARLTLGGKNLMGTILDRGGIHRNLGQRIADIGSVVRRQLTVIDAVRMLMANGPTGGSLDDVKQTDTVIASHDIVAADAYATTLFGLKPTDISYIVASAEMGIGSADLESFKIEELSL